MKFRLFFCWVFMLLWWSFCVIVVTFDAGHRLHARYQARIDDISKVKEIRSRMEDIADRWNLKIVDSVDDGYAVNTSLKEMHELYVVLFFRGRAILYLHNSDTDNWFTLTVRNRWDMRLENLERLIQDVLGELKEIDLKFYPTDRIYYADEYPE